MGSAAIFSLLGRSGDRDAKRRDEPGPGPTAGPEAERERLAGLLRATGEGDQAAFAELYRATAAKLYGFAVRIVKEDGQAQECLQDAFIRIWEHAGDYRSERGAPLTWMGVIVRRQALDRVRRKDRERILDDPDELDRRRDQLTHTEGPEAAVDPREWDRLSDCIGQLRQEQREAIRLAFFEGLAHPEVAERMAVPLGTVKTWIRRGMEKVRTCLEN
jgi:RNA polymerase sigma-70 factor (ECF subfamily)